MRWFFHAINDGFILSRAAAKPRRVSKDAHRSRSGLFHML
jgi:hypothetical protein